MKTSLLSSAALAVFLSGPAIHAQGSAGSPAGMTSAQALMASGGRSVLPGGNMAEGNLGQVATGPEAFSPNYILRDSVVWMPPDVGSGSPIVLGAIPGTGDKDGGEPVTVIGFNFAAPGASPLNVSFAGSPGTSTLVTSNTTATTVTPAGVNPFGNPLAASEVAVSNPIGAHAVEEAFVYLPALIQETPAQVGTTMRLRVLAAPGTFFMIGLALNGGAGVPFPPFDGAVELVSPQIVVGLSANPTGDAVVPFDVPGSPTVVGLQVYFQSVSFTLSPLAGSFTNSIQVTGVP